MVVVVQLFAASSEDTPRDSRFGGDGCSEVYIDHDGPTRASAARNHQICTVGRLVNQTGAGR